MNDQPNAAPAAVTFERRRTAAARSPLAVSVKEAAGMIGVSYMTLWRAIREGEFPGVKIRDRILVPVQAVQMLFAAAVESGELVDSAEWTAAWRAQGPAVAEVG
ncbi:MULTISPECIES: helix-turn-helix domain-containing protein [Streptomyces violaceusniger group]|uniref:Helix-turn-helix domain-containing protein n=1 Tax=Streptomyces malaysiensis TaxID=92644 RepID=A0A2J7Z9T0_STRMQ|nr:helix-turn-helix domain-containing protein [Streptomyces malaysiensis]MCQ6249246.1 helix-turn-helix domain-containing protein [Streptomyces malaysiensis]PNG97038.1 hypothetical protein SMF913_13063 [Streptomyces malaysiensis]